MRFEFPLLQQFRRESLKADHEVEVRLIDGEFVRCVCERVAERGVRHRQSVGHVVAGQFLDGKQGAILTSAGADGLGAYFGRGGAGDAVEGVLQVSLRCVPDVGD